MKKLTFEFDANLLDEFERLAASVKNRAHTDGEVLLVMQMLDFCVEHRLALPKSEQVTFGNVDISRIEIHELDKGE